VVLFCYKETMLKKVWFCHEEKSIAKYPLIELIEKHCRSQDQTKSARFVTVKTGDWCNAIAWTDQGNIVMVRQFRVGIDDFTLELPGGVIDASDKDPQAAALRELEEETGYVPLPGATCTNLGWAFPNPAIMNNRCYSVAVGPVEKRRAQKLDPGEMIDVLEVPFGEIPSRILKGEIRHALMLNNFFLWLLRSKSELLSTLFESPIK
jgi:ADP-ribose pyrophosphatase